MRKLCQALIIAAQLSMALIVRAQESQHEHVPGGTMRERPAPGTHSPYDNQRGGAVIGGRPGSMRPRVPINTHPHGIAPLPQGPQPLPPVEELPQAIRIPHAWAALFEVEDEGPPNGLTLEQAMERLLAESISLRARSLDIPQAQADVLTAGMHANPIVYADGQLLPYRHYSATSNPGGPAQYDLNVAYPFDLSGKRRARVEVASAAHRVVEALYQDAVRQELDRLGSAYIDTLASRLAVRTMRAGLARMEKVQQRPSTEQQNPQDVETQRRQLEIQRQTIKLALLDAENGLKSGQRTLSMMLNLPREQAMCLELRGTIDDNLPAPPPLADLVSSAIASRPDLVAYRLGLERAHADVRLSKANRLPDVYALYQPYTYQDNSPYNAPSSRSWAAGATVTVPLFDRNQGNIRRAQYNVEQSQLELRALELRVVAEVEDAYEDYLSTQRGIRQIETELIPSVEKTLGGDVRKFQQGAFDAPKYLNVQRDLDDLGRQYRDLLIRHRRSMLAVNTAVGIRVFP